MIELAGQTVETLMPRVDPRFLESVVYLYPDTSAAHSDESVGGSGSSSNTRSPA